MNIFELFFWTLGQIVAKLNTIVISNGVMSAGFFTILIGFLLFRILIKNYIK